MLLKIIRLAVVCGCVAGSIFSFGLVGAASATAPAGETAAQFCASYSGTNQTACIDGFNNVTKPENDACHKYFGDDVNACTAGWGEAAQKDPALTCVNDQCDLVARYVNPTINVLSASFGLIAVISIIMGAIQYSASEGDPQKAGAAKSRITNTILAVLAYLFLYAFLQFLVPGGIFNRSLNG